MVPVSSVKDFHSKHGLNIYLGQYWFSLQAILGIYGGWNPLRLPCCFLVGYNSRTAMERGMKTQPTRALSLTTFNMLHDINSWMDALFLTALLSISDTHLLPGSFVTIAVHPLWRQPHSTPSTSLWLLPPTDWESVTTAPEDRDSCRICVPIINDQWQEVG